jgi:predicted TIM-barrel fold metal-dependent hydrolase
VTRVFDVHVHIQPWTMLVPEVIPLIDDPSHAGVKDILASPENVLRYLDGEGVERACCINYVSPDVMGFTREVNDWVAAFTCDHRDRLLPVGSVNPLHEMNVRDEIRRVLDLGIRMIKIHPPHQLFAPNAYRGELWQLAEIYRECESRGVPVMFHTGTSIFPRARNVFADPMPIDDVAIDFPRLPIILAHVGRPLYGETAVFLARRHRNVFLDLSGIPPKALLKYVPRLADLAHKALWGTDWPSPGVVSMRRNVDDFLALGLGEEGERRILWDNAAALFG